MRAEIKMGVTEIDGEEYARTYEEAFPMDDWENGRLDLFDGEEVIRSQAMWTSETLEQKMERIFNEMLENAGWSEEQDDAVAEFKNRLEEEMQDLDDETGEADNQ